MDYKYVELNIPKPSKKEDTGPKSIIESNSVTLIVGKMGQGKSKLVCEMIKNNDLLGKKFNAIFFFTPSDFEDIPRNEKFFRATLDLDWLAQNLEDINEKCKQKGIKASILVVMDDMVSDLFSSKNNMEFQRLVLNRRHHFKHITISYIFTTQYLKLFPKKYRSVLNYLICFPIDASDWVEIQKNYIFQKGDKITSIVTAHFTAPGSNGHNFICIDLYSQVLFLNFTKSVKL